MEGKKNKNKEKERWGHFCLNNVKDFINTERIIFRRKKSSKQGMAGLHLYCMAVWKAGILK